MNQVAYRLLRNNRRPDAIVVFRKIVELYPGSSNAHDSLAEALEAAGEKAEAVSVTRKGLEVLEREELPDARRQQMKEMLEGRLRRLAPEPVVIPSAAAKRRRRGIAIVPAGRPLRPG